MFFLEIKVMLVKVKFKNLILTIFDKQLRQKGVRLIVI